MNVTRQYIDRLNELSRQAFGGWETYAGNAFDGLYDFQLFLTWGQDQCDLLFEAHDIKGGHASESISYSMSGDIEKDLRMFGSVLRYVQALAKVCENASNMNDHAIQISWNSVQSHIMNDLALEKFGGTEVDGRIKYVVNADTTVFLTFGLDALPLVWEVVSNGEKKLGHSGYFLTGDERVDLDFYGRTLLDLLLPLLG